MRTATVGVEMREPLKGCFACTPMPAGPDRDACLCRAPVGFPYAALVLEPPPAEPEARLEHLRRQASLAAGASAHAEREANYQDRWDPHHARDLRATSIIYARAEQRLQREIKRIEREVEVARPRSAPTPKTGRALRRGNTRRGPGRAPRPAGRRATARLAAADSGGSGGDPPSGDPDPAPPWASAASTAPTLAATGLPGAAARAVITGTPVLSRPETGSSRLETTDVGSSEERSTCSVPARLASAGAYHELADTFSATSGEPSFSTPADGRPMDVSLSRTTVITPSHGPSLTLAVESENGRIRRSV